MNKASFYLLSRKSNIDDIDQRFLDDLYEFYEGTSQCFDCEINIDKEDFQEILRTIYNVLKVKASKKEINLAIDSYLKHLIYDSIDGQVVDTDWFIKHVWYLCYGDKNEFYKKYKSCINFIQHDLIEKFDVKENFKEKISKLIPVLWKDKINT